MGKQGPCCHCGVTSTPLWRNGPSEKPILCNACGSRWRTKGTLANYTPLHARAETTDGFDDNRSSRVKTVSLKAKEMKFPKRKFNENEHNFVSQKSHFDDTSNRSSTGSAISNSFSESCGQFDVGDAADLTDPAQHIVKKRTCVGQTNGSSVERLTRDLCTILHEQRQSKQFSLSYEEDLIFENDTSMVSVEIGHGSMLIRCPSSVAKDEESEASSLSVENKLFTPTYPKRGDKAQNEKLKIEGNHNPQLLHVDLNDVVNFDVFTHYLSHEEQQQLLKHLPSLDTASLPNSLQSMFSSNQFKENIWSFQKLLAEDVLNHSLPGVSAEECRPLKKLVLSNFSKSKWLEQYTILKDAKSKVKDEDLSGVPKQKNDNITKSGNSTITWSTGDNPSHHSGLTMKSSNDHHKEAVSSESGLFIAFPLDDSSTMLNSSQFLYDASDQDLLLDVPFNNAFPEAELLLPAPNFGSKASTSCSSSSTSPQFLQP